jgi:hypothetical protein
MLEYKNLGPLNTDDPDRDLDGGIRDCLNLVPQIGGRGSSPRRETLKGTTQLNCVLPSGTNITVGQFEDKDHERVYFFNYNSNNNHGIYAMVDGFVYELAQSSLLNFTEETVISGAGVVDSTIIWTDGDNEIGSINYDHAIITNTGLGAKEWEVVVDRNSNDTYTGSIDLDVTLPASSYTISLPTPTESTFDDDIDSWVVIINGDAWLQAERCGDNVKISERTSGTVESVVAVGNIDVAATNHYILPLTDRELRFANVPPLCEPTFEYIDDTTKKINLVAGKQFQFRSRYVYYDNTKSTLSPISDLAYNRSCVGGSTTNNCIRVTFNETTYDQRELSLVKNVEVYFREGNTGAWYLADSLSRSEYMNGIYDFCNDGVYKILDDQTANKNFDSIPLKANSLTALKNRVFLGGVTEGYDTPCIEADVDVDISDVDPTTTENTWTIEGYIRITNPYQSDDDMRNSQPVWQFTGKNNDAYVFGGFYDAGLDPNGVVDNVGVDYKQYIPQGGFTVYLAGTTYRATSKQVYKKDTTATDLSLPPSVGDGVYDFSTSANRQAVRNDLIKSGRKVYQKFSITDVKPGRYLLRVASHNCYEGETPSYISDPEGYYRIDDTLKFQQTSTNIRVIDEAVTDPTDFQTLVPQRTWATSERNGTNDFEIAITLNEGGGTLSITDSVICINDLSCPVSGSTGYASQFFVRDLDVSERSDINTSVSVEKASVVIRENLTPKEIFQTDHNGYSYYGSSAIGVGLTSVQAQIYSGENQIKAYGDKTALGPPKGSNYNLSSVYDGSAGTSAPLSDFNSNGNTEEFIVMAKDSSVRNNSRTRIEGRVTSDGLPVSGALVLVNGTNEYQYTDSVGNYDILTFSESDTNGLTKSRSTTVYISAGASACLYDDDPINGDRKRTFTISPYDSGGYNNTNPFSPVTFALSNITDLSTAVDLKRGGTFGFGVVYYDQYNRSSLVSTDLSLKKSIPFYTEDLSVALPDVGYSSGTYRYGSPSLTWEIRNTPPSWATKWRWVRTKNTAQEDYLSWLVDSVEYVVNYSSSKVKDDTFAPELIEPTTYANGNANQIFLNLDNILLYNSNDPSSKIGYSFTDGDRCIIYKNEGEYLTDYIDLPVKGFVSGNVVIEALGTIPELKGNVEIQLYSPKANTEEQLYYEIGPCYDIVNGYHEGDTQTQTASLPAQGTIVGGDTYKVERRINTGTDLYTDPQTTGSSTSVLLDHHSINDSIDSKDQSIGRINIVNKDFKQQNLFSTIRFSNPYIQDTFINGIKSLDAEDDYALPNERGTIRKLVGTSDIMLAIHETETSSVYVGEQYLSTPDGAGILSQTDNVIGDDNLLKGEFGTVNPESVVEWNDNVFWWDNIKAEPIMYSANGLEPLGTVRGMRNYFLGKVKERKNHLSSNPDDYSRVYGGYDPEKKMFILSFNDMGSLDGDTIGFNDDYNFWSTRLSFKPEHFVKLSNNFYSFKNGCMWQHDQDDVNFNRFYGVDYPYSFKIVSNENSEVEKIYRNVAVKTNKLFTVKEISNRDGQLSDLVESDLVQRDNMYYSDILRDKNTNTDKLQAGQTALLHGDVMRSQIMEFEFESDETGQVFVEYVVVGYQYSPGHLLELKR